MVHNNTTELNRVIQTCSETAIDLYFRTQVDIPAGLPDSISHQLYYGNADAGSPPADPNQVWFPFDESDSTNLYYFQEGSGSTAFDSSGNNRHCAIDASVQWAAAKWGHGLRFNRANAGDSRSLGCGSVPALGAFTVEFWYNPDSDGDGRIAGALAGGGNGGGGNNWLLQAIEKRIRLDVWPCGPCGSSDVRSDFELNQAPYLGHWNHIGSLIYLRVKNYSAWLLAMTSTFLIAVAYLGLSVAGTLLIACLISVVGGVGNGVQWIAVMTALQEHTARDYQARISGMMESLGAAMPGVGFLLGGAIVALSSPRAAYAVAGFGLIILLVLALPLRTRLAEDEIAPGGPIDTDAHGALSLPDLTGRAEAAAGHPGDR